MGEEAGLQNSCPDQSLEAGYGFAPWFSLPGMVGHNKREDPVSLLQMVQPPARPHMEQGFPDRGKYLTKTGFAPSPNLDVKEAT